MLITSPFKILFISDETFKVKQFPGLTNSEELTDKNEKNTLEYTHFYKYLFIRITRFNQLTITPRLVSKKILKKVY